MRGSRPAIVLGALALLLVLGGAASATIGSRSGTCALCHGDLVSALGHDPHSATGCYECHVSGPWDWPRQKLSEVFRMYPIALFGGGLAGPARETPRQSCLECHDEVVEGIASGVAVRIDHTACAPAPSCDPCHASSGHGSTIRRQAAPVMEECVACHEEEGVSTECDTCHVDDEAADLNPRGPWQVVHGPDSEQTHGMGDVSTCAGCHPASTFEVTGFCAECHGVDVPHPTEFGGSHGEYAVVDVEACDVCHDGAAFCDECHQMDMPHPADFTAGHRDAADGDQDPLCLRCHVKTDCTQCHMNHVHPGGSQGVPVPWIQTSEERRPPQR